MRKLKSCSFLFIAIVFFTSGFLFSTAYAEVTIIEDEEGGTIWTAEESPYIFSDDVFVNTGATLTIEPGVIVKMENSASLVVYGSVMALGTFEDPIYFTSTADDSHGGDTNYDENDTVPSSGDWYGIIITPESDDPNIDNSTQESSTLNYVISRYSDGGLLIFDKNVTSEGLNVDERILLFNSNSTFDKLSATMFNLWEGSTATLDNSTINCTEEYSNGVSLSDASKLDIVNTSINVNTPDGGDGILIFNGSSLSLDNVQIDVSKESWGRGIMIFDEGTTLSMRGSSIVSNDYALGVYNDTKATIDNSTFECTGTFCVMGYNSYILMTNSKVSGATMYGVFYDDEPKTKQECTDNYDENGDSYQVCADVVLPPTFSLELNNNEIFNNNVGIFLVDGKIIGKKNNIHNNVIGALNNNYHKSEEICDEEGVCEESPESKSDDSMGLRNNYWGDKTGPKNTHTNPAGLGNEISGRVLYSPFLKIDPSIPTKNPVIIVPGVMGTEMIRDYGDKDEIWPAISKVIFSIFDNYLRELELLPNGDENLDFPMKVGDIIRDIPSTDIFNGLVSELENNGGYKEGENLFVFPYDWRFSSTKNAELLKEKIDQVLADTEKDKVDIIAHSMGGLLTKEYIKENGEDKIDHLIFLGTPHLGAVKAYKALVYGDSMGFSISINNSDLIKFLNNGVVKAISQNMPSIYELLPSSKYVSGLRYISEETIGSGLAYLDYDDTKNLLKAEGTNENLVQSAETFHQNIDDIDLSGINVSNISACGEATLSAINISKKLIGKDYKLSYANGDGTVPLDSSYGIANVNKYVSNYFVDKISHSALPSAPDVPDTVLDILENKEVLHGGKVFADINNCTPINGYILSIHSPLTLDIYDANGNHSGLDAYGNLENNIEGVSYDTIGDAKFAFIPDGLSVNVRGSATGSGTFDLAIEKVVNGETTETKFWNDVPITSTSQMSFDFNSYSNTNSIELDNKGAKTNIPNSNILSEGEDYLAVPANITETRKQSSSGSYIKNNSKLVLNIPKTEIKQGISPVIKKVDIKKQAIIKKPLAKVIEKKVVINKETIIPTSNLGASVINAGQGIDLWGTIKSFFRWLFHIKK